MKESLTHTELFSRLLKSPSDFMLVPSLPRIRAFIAGYYFAAEDHGVYEDVYRGFSQWVADRYQVRTTHDWESIISFEAGSEADAMTLAGQLWEKYLTGIKVTSMELNAARPPDDQKVASISLSRLLDLLLERPVLYIGHSSVIRIKAFLDGYKFAQASVSNGFDDHLYNGFSNWVAQRFNKDNHHQWDRIINFMGISESASFELLRELWIEYKSEVANNN